MSNKQNWRVTCFLVLSLMVILLGCSLNLGGEHQTTDTEPQTNCQQPEDVEEISLAIYVEGFEQVDFTHKYEIVGPTSLLELMKDHYRLVEEEGEILCIEGNGQDLEVGKVWRFEVNGVPMETNPENYYIKGGDRIEWFLDKGI